MDIMQSLPVFMLFFCRITAFFVVSPVFSSQNVPNTFKIGLSGIVALLLYLLYGTTQTVPTDLTYLVFVVREILIGLLLGYLATLMFSVIMMAGTFIDNQIGFSIANVLNPMTGLSAPITGNFHYVIATLFFLGMNGHHYLLTALLRSYQWIPLNNDVFSRIYQGNVGDFLLAAFGQAFMLAFQLAAPLVAALFLTDVALGFLAKTAPQFNIYVIGIPLKIIVGLVLLVVLMSSIVYSFQLLFETLFKSLGNLLDVLGSKP